MSKRLFLGLFLAVAGLTSMSKEVPIDVAKHAGIRFYNERINQFRPVGYPEIKVTGTFIQQVNGTAVYYIFNMEPIGYIVVSADDAVTPFLAYSFDGPYSGDNAPAQFTAWMKQYEGQIDDAIRHELKPLPAILELWNKYRDTSRVTRDQLPENSKDSVINRGVTRHASRVTPAAVAPLIFSNWNQNAPYNEQCPADPGGPGGHTYAGCVPVCMGQLMYYYRWPDTGTGNYSYLDPIYGTISADFGNTTYEWENMTNSISASNPGIAKLLFHLGVSCDLVYGPDGSGMYNHKAAFALRTFFKYSPETRYIFRDSTNLNWDSILIAHLDRRMPMYYAGWSVPNVNGHAFVCDGYQGTGFFHFNFGWSGQNNGYFYTSNLTPGGNNFQLSQEVIIDAYPDTVKYTYPVYSTGLTHLTNPVGSITDGSGPMNDYQPNPSCSWLIDPQPADDSISSITLTFNEIITNSGDQVTVYDGATVDAPVLGAFSGDTLPPAITGTRNKMLVKFTGNSGLSGPGWFATYKSKSPVWCSGTTNIKADTVLITDGSYGFNYHNNSICRWLLESKSGNPLTIHFNRFDTELGKDFLRIYEIPSGDTLAIISGNYEPGNLPDSVTSPNGKMMLIFMTNSSVTRSGWEIYYPQSHVGTIDDEFVDGLEIFPNPADHEINIQYSLNSPARVEFRIKDMTGKPLKLQSSDGQSGKNTQQLDVSALKPGVYLLQVASDQSIQNHKLIIR